MEERSALAAALRVIQAFVAYQALQAYLLALMQRLLEQVPRVVSKSHRPTSRGRPHFLLSYRFVVVLVEVTVAVVAVAVESGTTFATLGGGRSAKFWLNSDSPVCTCPSLSNKDVIVFDVSGGGFLVCSAALKLISFFVGAKMTDANELQFTVALSFSWSCCCCCSALLFVSSSNNPPNKSGDSLSMCIWYLSVCPPCSHRRRRWCLPSSSIQILSNNAAFTNPFILLVSLLSGFGNFNSSYLAKYFLFAFSFLLR